MTAAGFAVLWKGRIDVNTVSETERAAKVNGLVTRFRHQILNNDPDDYIAEVWARLERQHGGDLSIVPVSIALRPDA